LQSLEIFAELFSDFDKSRQDVIVLRLVSKSTAYKQKSKDNLPFYTNTFPFSSFPGSNRVVGNP